MSSFYNCTKSYYGVCCVAAIKTRHVSVCTMTLPVGAADTVADTVADDIADIIADDVGDVVADIVGDDIADIAATCSNLLDIFFNNFPTEYTIRSNFSPGCWIYYRIIHNI